MLTSVFGFSKGKLLKSCYIIVATVSQSALMYASIPNCDVIDKKKLEHIPEPL